MNLREQVGSVLDEAEQLLPDDCHDEIHAARERLGGPLRLAIVGKVKAGKSTLLNALVGERVAPTDAGECTYVVTRYRNGPYYAVTAHTIAGDKVELPFNRTDRDLTFDLAGLPVDDVAYVDVEWPTSRLDGLVLIDTPGLASANRSRSLATERFLQRDDNRVEADAVVYLMRHLHPMDMSFLEAFADGMAERWASVNSIAVLSRADEIGAARVQAMHSARRVADRYRRDPRIRAVAQVVTPVAGLVAQAAPTLSQERMDMLAEVAAHPDRTALLLSARRFCEADGLASSAQQRREALEELGLFGVRLGCELMGSGRTTTADELADAFERESGIEELRTLLAGRVLERGHVLQARSALVTVHALARQVGGEVGRRLVELITDVQRSAHELVEIGVLAALAAGDHGLGATATEAARLLGGDGPKAATRLGLDPDAGRDQIRSAALAAVQRWREIAEDPMTARSDREIAAAVTRSCEGLAHDPHDRQEAHGRVGAR